MTDTNSSSTISQTSFISWTIFRGFVPIIVAAIAGVIMAFVRYEVLFIPGVQGMIAGGLLGWFFGSRIKKDTTQYWDFGQTHWFLLNIALTFTICNLLFLSYLNMPTIAGPEQWLVDIIRGFEYEEFTGTSFASLVQIDGSLSGSSWIFFNLLDFGLFLFLGAISTGVARGESHSEKGKIYVGKFSHRLFMLQWAAFVAIALIYTGIVSFSETESLSFGNRIARMNKIAGTYAFEDGAGIVAKRGVSGKFRLVVYGTDMLMLQSQEDENIRFSLTERQGAFRGTIYNYSPMVGSMPVTGKYNESDNTFVLTIRPFTSGSSRSEVVVTAKKIQ